MAYGQASLRRRRLRQDGSGSQSRFQAILAGKQVAFLVPTTILAYQHFTTAMARMRPYPITIEMLSRFRSPAQQEGNFA